MGDTLLLPPSSPQRGRRPPAAAAPRLLVLSFLLLMQWAAVVVPLARADDGAGDAAPSTSSQSDPPSTSRVLGSNSTATSLKCPNSTKDIVDMPAVSLSLALGVSQELNPNPFIHPNPVLSLSLSLSVSEELRGNPFELMNDMVPPTPPPAEGNAPRQEDPNPQQQQQQQQQQRQRRQQQEQEQRQPQRAEKPQEQPQPIKQRASRGPATNGREERSATGRGGGRCTYTVSIKTSCTSPRATRDAISLAFGDADHNEVYASRLDDPASGAFDRCSMDTFRVDGPCGSRTCYLYLRRSGRDGWTPEYAKVYYNLSGDPHATVTFPFDAPLPNDFWYGFNLCRDGAAAMSDRGQVQDSQDGGGGDDRNEGGDPRIKMKTKVGGSVKTVILRV